jgi:glutamine amidotransferase
VRRFEANGLKVPQIGWNTLTGLRSPLFKNIADGSHVYFVHSYFVEAGPETVATAEYGTQFSAAVRQENFYAVQFHPEKSGGVGRRILENFLGL